MRDGETPGLETALDAMAGWPYGWLFLAATGIGLIAFGVYAFAEARYRRDRHRLRDVMRRSQSLVDALTAETECINVRRMSKILIVVMGRTRETV